LFFVRSKTKKEVRLDDNAVTGLGAREHRVEGLALPKSVESGKLSVNKADIGRMSL